MDPGVFKAFKSALSSEKSVDVFFIFSLNLFLLLSLGYRPKHRTPLCCVFCFQGGTHEQKCDSFYLRSDTVDMTVFVYILSLTRCGFMLTFKSHLDYSQREWSILLGRESHVH